MTDSTTASSSPSSSTSASPPQREKWEAAALNRVPFDEAPFAWRGRSFGVEYLRLDQPGGGILYLTRYGWGRLENLLPELWFDDKAYLRVGQRMPGATGSVYYVPTQSARGRKAELVVKFSRFAQHVPIYVASGAVGNIPKHVLDEARFNSPFEEFGLTMALRGKPGDADFIQTKRPLAIYSPGEQFELWRLGRTKGQFYVYNSALQSDQGATGEAGQGAKIELDLYREYILVYEYVKGFNAEQMYDKGLLSESELKALTRRITGEMAAKGFQVLDNKPRHYILRQRRRDGQLMRRAGQLVYALVDFELLQRIRRANEYL
jgi:hypothetical protein